MARKKRKAARPVDDPRWTWDLPPAPGELRILHAFVKSAEDHRSLSSPAALSDWLTLWELLPAESELGTVEFERALEVRQALRALVAANSGKAVDEAEVERLDHALSSASFHLRCRAGAVFRYESATDDFDGALGRLVGIVAKTHEGPWRRIKMCREERCGLVYYDFSKSITGKWCTPRCGNRLSALGYRLRFERRHGRPPGAIIRGRWRRKSMPAAVVTTSSYGT